MKDLSVYGVYDKTFIPQSGIGINDTTITDPLRGQNLEIGLKKTGLREWSSTFAMYEIRRQNILVAGNKTKTMARIL